MHKKKTDVFVCEIGNLDENEECVVDIEYITELKLENGQIRFYLPTVVAPKFSSTHTAEEDHNMNEYLLAISVDVQLKKYIKKK